MADNTHRYGFRWNTGANGGKSQPTPVPKVVASGYQAQDDAAANNVDLNVGDPVKLVSTGTVALANTTDAVWGIVTGFGPYWNGTQMQPTNRLPGGTAWGTVEERRSTVYVVPVIGSYFVIDCDDKVTATTEAAYRAFIGENCTFVCPGDTSSSSKPKADPMLDISTHATTAGLVCRIEDIHQEVDQDFSGLYVKMVVSFNKTQHAGQAATTIAGV